MPTVVITLWDYRENVWINLQENAASPYGALCNALGGARGAPFRLMWRTGMFQFTGASEFCRHCPPTKFSCKLSVLPIFIKINKFGIRTKEDIISGRPWSSKFATFSNLISLSLWRIILWAKQARFSRNLIKVRPSRELCWFVTENVGAWAGRKAAEILRKRYLNL